MANFFAKEFVEGFLEGRVNHCGVLEVIVGKEVELVQKVADVDTTERIHLREWENAWESEDSQHADKDYGGCTYVSSSRGFSGMNQLTFMTLSYSSRLAIGMGI